MIPERPKRVVFATAPQIHRDIPWKSGESKILNDEDVLYPMQSSMKRLHLRTQIEAEENVSLLGVVILVACLVFLFCLIWFVVNKILLLEIEAQVFGPAQEKVSQALVRQYVPRAVKRFT